MKKLVALMVLAVSAHATVAFAQSADCVEITGLPVTISQPGKYCLYQGFTVNSATIKAITVAANDVTLDCRGHTIRNTATSNAGSSEGVYAVGRSNVTVRNCRIQGGFTNGISIIQDSSKPTSSYYNTIEGNYVAASYWHGIRAYGSAIEIKGNRVVDVGGQANNYAIGIRVAGSTVTGSSKLQVVQDNAVWGTNSPYNNAYGIMSDSSLASLIRMNSIVGTTASNQTYRSYGVRIAAGTVNTIIDNHIVGSPLANDIAIQTPTGNSCHDNTLRSPTPTVGCDASLGNY
jgi:hypothetical protein